MKRNRIIAILVVVCMSLSLAIGLVVCKKCEHVYDNACDTICNICSEERTITHTPNDDDGDCTTEITCSVCGTTTTPAKDSHAGGTATCTDKAVCTVCGTAYGTIDANNHIDENTDHICDRQCGKTDIGTHADSAEDNDHVCDYGCGATLNNHEGGTEQTCKGYQCDICGEWYGEKDVAAHTLTYTANGNIITESCSVGCGYSETATITADGATYNGAEHNTATVEYSEGWKGGELTVSYTNNVNAGTATASITVGEVTASVDFTVAKATVTVTADAKIKTYGDENPPLTYTAEGLLGGDTLTSALTGALSREEGENVGSYAITLGTLYADNYTISFVGADFIIQVKEVTNPTVNLDQISYQYDGNVKEPKVTSIVVDGRTLTEGTDYTISYEDNVYVNTEAKVVINFMGNYDGTFKKWFTITQALSTTEFNGECIGNGELLDIQISQTTNSSTGYDLSLPIHIYQSVPETETPAVEFVGQQLNIGGGISMKFYVRNNEDRPLESISIEVEFIGKLTYLIECEKHPTEDKVYIYTFEGITPQCLGDPMNVVILIGGSPVEHENAKLVDYSVEKNLLEIRKTADDLTVQLIDDLLAYGEAASAYKGNQTMSGTSYAENGSDRVIPVSEAQVTDVIAGYTLRFGTSISIIIEVNPNAFDSEIYKVECNGTELRNFPSPNSPLYKVTNIDATDFDEKFNFVVRSTNPMGAVYGTVVVSVNDYLYVISQSTDASDEMKALAKALYNYGFSAKAYEHLSNGYQNHVYTDNGDGTHSSTCQYCGLSPAEEHFDYMDENCKCTKCGVEHYLPYVDEGDCCCLYCDENIHNPDENCVCTVCSLVVHTVDSATGICSVCDNFVAAASITVDDVKTYYARLEEAIAYANSKDSTVIVIENDCSIIDMGVRLKSGNITIDLNGKTVDSMIGYSMPINGATVTIRDSVGGGKTLKTLGGWSGTLIIEDGTHSEVANPTNLVITGGEFARLSLNNGKATISGGSFETISIHKNTGTLDDILADGYCFYDQDGNVVDTSTLQTDEIGWYCLYNVTVGAIK